MPDGFDGYVPCLQKKDLLLCGTPDIEGIADLKFEISQEKAFQIIEGSNIYKDKFIFIRELLQNAADASKLQLWEDLTSGIYQAWIGHNKEIAALQPYEIDEKIYQNYPIDIKLATQENNLTEVEVSDCGTGISIETFKLMCRVGTSNSGSKRIQNDIRSMPNWLRPTAGFGVGLQSIFLLTESFEIDTNTGKETFHAVVQSNRSGGYLQLQRTELSRPRGTTIRFRFRMPRQFQYSMMGETQSYLGLHFDPLSSQDHLGEVRVIEAIHNNCGSSLFPVNVSFTEEHIEHLKLLNMLPVSGIQAETWRNYNNRYRIDISHPEKMILIWDSQTASYGEIRFVRRGYRRFCFRFKGNDVEKDTPYLRASGISVLLDVYGLNTRETITLDRSGLTQEGVKAVAEIWNDMFPACIDCLLEEIAAKKNLWNQLASGEDEFSAYTIWLLCSPDQREKMPLELLSKMQDHAVVLIKEENGYVKKTKPVNDLISTMEKNRYVNVESFDTHIGENPVNYAQICEIMNCGEPSNAEIVIADSTFQNSMDAMWLKALQMPVTDEQLWIYSISHQQTLIKADEKTQKILLKGLSEHIPGMNYSFSYRSYKAKRYAIPALTKYRDLAVNDLPYGFAVPHGHYRCSYVIAPFTREEIKKLDGMSKDAFCEWILSLPIFQRLVDFIKEHSIRSENIPNEQIVEQYKILIHDYYSATDNFPNSVTEVT